MKNMLVNINIPKLIETPEIYKINENSYIQTEIYEKRNDKYCDVNLYNIKENSSLFIGRFIDPLERVKVSYNEGKILVYFGNYNANVRGNVVTKVLLLYDIIEDFNYACTEEEALIIFDKNVDTNFLKNKNAKIIKTDLERKKRKTL